MAGARNKTANATRSATTRRARAAQSSVVQAGGISDAAVTKATGCGWDRWFKMLDHEGAASLDHKGIVALVEPHLPRSGWWAQMVTVAYEQARGLRAKHERPDGWSVSASKTLAVPVATVFRAFADARARKRWLKEPLEIRKATPNKSLRITWGDGSNLDVNLYPKGASKSSVQLEHAKLKSAASVARQKAFWKDALDRLSKMLTT